MSQIFGEFLEEIPPNHHSLELIFKNLSQPNKRQWRNHRLSAYFIADYFANILLIEEENRIKECKNAVSYIGNELLENAIKFNEINKDYPIQLGIYCLEDAENLTAVIFSKNSINYRRVEKFQDFIQELLSTHTNELYVQQIEKITADEHSETSGIGLLTIINDYSAKLGWKFQLESSNPEIVTVTTMAQIIV